ncbi:MAG: Uncharacterised protein [Hyphomonas sp. TMED17]|nr:MAG: Uncharacterised protein [Hyphomonas sp. TMED17]
MLDDCVGNPGGDEEPVIGSADWTVSLQRILIIRVIPAFIDAKGLDQAPAVRQGNFLGRIRRWQRARDCCRIKCLRAIFKFCARPWPASPGFGCRGLFGLRRRFRRNRLRRGPAIISKRCRQTAQARRQKQRLKSICPAAYFPAHTFCSAVSRKGLNGQLI